MNIQWDKIKQLTQTAPEHSNTSFRIRSRNILEQSFDDDFVGIQNTLYKIISKNIHRLHPLDHQFL